MTTPQAATASSGPPQEWLEDGYLVAAAASGDEGAFAVLVRTHTDAMYGAAFRVTGDVGSAEDVVQEAWLSAWTHLWGFGGRSTVRTWLITITIRKALNAVRQGRKRAAGETELPRWPAGGPSAEQEAVARARGAAVRQAVSALPGRQRDAVVLRDLEGLSYDQVAGALQCSVPSVKSALFRGRQALAVALADWSSRAASGESPHTQFATEPAVEAR